MVDLIAVLRAAGYESTARKLADPLTWGRSSRSLTALDRECLLRVRGGRPALGELRASLRASLDEPPGIELRGVECECISVRRRLGPP